jgi:predicted RNase H-like HicB family nuclease
MIHHYPAVIEGDDAGGYGVTFPDFPGCAAAGETIEEAVANAGEALLFHLEGMAEDSDPIPEPSRLDAPLPDWLAGGMGVRILVPVKPPGKSVRINITMDKDLVDRVDRVAEAHHQSRSGLLAQLARKALREMAAEAA